MNELDDTGPRQLQAIIGRQEQRQQTLDHGALERFAAAVGLPDGQPISPVAHWAFFHDVVPDRQLGADGHPLRGAFLPDIAGLPLRMFAASDIRLEAPLRFGEPARMSLRIADIRYRKGGSGELVFVDVLRTIEQADVVRVVETQTLVYRPPSAAAQADLPEAGPATPDDWLPGRTNLFRFSAATFNSHRIHYDHTYATQVEGYPDLVVHGPFIAAKLANVAAARGELAAFSFRARAACFVDQPIRLAESAQGHLQAIRCDGIVCMDAKAGYR